MQSNLEIFRKAIKEYLPSEQIDSPQEFIELANHLCDLKLLSPTEVQRLSHRARSDIAYPFSFPQFQQLIMTAFADPQSQQMLQQLKELRLRLRETKGVLAVWKEKGLSQKQRLQLESTFQRGNARLREFYQQLTAEKEALQVVNEQEAQMISSLDEWVKMQRLTQPFHNYIEYQAQHSKLIDQIYSKIRVREVHFKQRKNTSKINKIQIALALDSRNDEPVQVTIVPKRSLEFTALNQQLLTFNARKELMLSPHFSRFLGLNSHSDAHCFLYFGEYLEGTNLQSIISSSRIELDEETPIFKYWASLLYRCLYDLFLMCSYRPRLPFMLSHFQACSSGLKIILKTVQFIEPREEEEEDEYEADLLQNLGRLILGLLKVEVQAWSTQTKLKNVQNRNVLGCLLHAKQGHQSYRQGRTKGKVGFFNLQTHPLFQSANLAFGQIIIQNYQAITVTLQA